MWCSFRRLANRRSITSLLNFQKQLSFTTNCSSIFLKPAAAPNLEISRFKGKKSKIRSHVTESESDKESEENLIEDRHTKILDISVPSLRLDAIIKAGLGIARNKVDVIFYENKVRVNGEKVPKKSVSCRPGDEIDVIKGVSVMNPEFLTVARIEILAAEAEGDKIELRIKRNKALTIDNYSGSNKHE